jgi:hypothetical protein
MPSQVVRLPRRIVAVFLGLCLVPVLLNLCGVSFEAPLPADVEALPADEQAYYHSAFFQLRPAFVHSLLEWTSCCLAIVTAFCAFVHYAIKKDVATPIIGTALLFSGLLDAFHVLAADKLILFVSDNEHFIPFTWAMSRIFHAAILTAGAGMFVWRRKDAGPPKPRGVRFVVLVSIMYGLLAYLLIQICAVAPNLPQTIFPGRPIPRPYDAVALASYLFGGGIVFPRFYRRHPSLFSHGLMVSLVPYLLSQAYAAFASNAQYDNALNVSQYLKIVAHLVPLAGLLFDYTRAFRAEAALRATEEQLRIAREIQRGLLPKDAPSIPGFELAGCSTSAEAVGGDYYDFIEMPDGCWGAVIADVSGHDLGASILMSQTRAYLRSEASRQADVGQIVTRLNQFLMRDVRDRRFVSLFFARLDPVRKSLTYAAPGQNGHLLRANGVTDTLPATGPLLGVVDGPQPIGPEIALQPGDILFLFTDGIAEAAAPTGEPFGNDRIFEIVRQQRSRPAAEILVQIERRALAFRQQVPIEDDVTLLLVKCT